MSDSKIFTSASANDSDPDENQRTRSKTTTAAPHTVVVHTSPSFWRSWAVRMLMTALGFSIMLNFSFYSAYQEYFSKTEPPIERFHSGDKVSEDKIALINADGTIMPPFTERLIDQIKHASKDDSVKGIVLQIDSPGGLVADSHEIYHRLKQVTKPIYVQMKRMAASGGYYIAMGAGPESRIYAEPTTWTGSIGVIIPRYDFSELAGKYGVRSDPLKTGEFKDALNPFREMTERERDLWKNIIDQSFQKFLNVIDENRSELDLDGVKALATGQIYTADDAKQNKMVDEIGFVEDAIDALKQKLNLKEARVVTYETKRTLAEQILGTSSKAQTLDPIKVLTEASVPRALYLCSWWTPIPESLSGH